MDRFLERRAAADRDTCRAPQRVARRRVDRPRGRGRRGVRALRDDERWRRVAKRRCSSVLGGSVGGGAGGGGAGGGGGPVRGVLGGGGGGGVHGAERRVARRRVRRRGDERRGGRSAAAAAVAVVAILAPALARGDLEVERRVDLALDLVSYIAS